LILARKEQDNLRFNNNNLLERNNDVKAEIDALNSHCNVLQGQNKDLNIELERFVQTDEQIRATLNRRDRVLTLRELTEAEIARSAFEVARTSPIRRRWLIKLSLIKVVVRYLSRKIFQAYSFNLEFIIIF